MLNNIFDNCLEQYSRLNLILKRSNPEKLKSKVLADPSSLNFIKYTGYDPVSLTCSHYIRLNDNSKGMIELSKEETQQLTNALYDFKHSFTDFIRTLNIIKKQQIQTPDIAPPDV